MIDLCKDRRYNCRHTLKRHLNKDCLRCEVTTSPQCMYIISDFFCPNVIPDALDSEMFSFSTICTVLVFPKIILKQLELFIYNSSQVSYSNILYSGLISWKTLPSVLCVKASSNLIKLGPSAASDAVQLPFAFHIAPTTFDAVPAIARWA